ncbi:MAG: type I restriction enzyme HsdR N-terminal domain-containing protein [Desulfobacteraceae bacterium]
MDNPQTEKSTMGDTIIDYATGMELPLIGPEENRQRFERALVEEKGYAIEEIRVNETIQVMFKDQPYVSTLDLVVFCRETPIMAVKCIAGSLGSYEREILAGARLVYDHQIPFSVSTDGKEALVRIAATGGQHKKGSRGLDAVPSREEAEEMLSTVKPEKFPEEKREREMLIFRTYNIEVMNKEC